MKSWSRGWVSSGWVPFAALVLAAFFWAPFFDTADLTGFGDWQWFHRQWEIGRMAYLRYGELPLWDSSHCGGVTLWGQPQNQVFAPLYLLFALPFGTVLGTKLWAITHTCIGMWGAWSLSRGELQMSKSGAAFAAMVWGCSGFFAWHGAGGHSTYFAFYYLPWLVLAHRRSMMDARYSVLVAGVIAMTLFEGGHYPAPYFLFVLVLEGFYALFVHRKTPMRVVRAELLSGLLTLCLSAFRIVPIVRAVAGNPKDVPDVDDALDLHDVWTMLTAKEHGWRFDEHHWVWPEYGTYVGVLAVMIALAGLALALRKKPFLVVSFLFFFALMLGDHGPRWPWHLMHQLPFYDRFHAPSRFAVFVSFYGALAGGLAISAVARIGGHRKNFGRVAGLVAALIVVLVGFDMLPINRATNDRWASGPLHEGEPDGRYHLVSGGDYNTQYASYPARNVGVRQCYDPAGWSVASGLWVGDRPQARVLNDGAASDTSTVHDWGRRNTSAFAELNVDENDAGEDGALVVFNQNYADGWRSNIGHVIEHEGLIAVTGVPAGDQRIELEFAPSELWPLTALLVFGLLLCAFILWRDGRGRRSTRS